jgi:hypothetical protein
MYLECHEVGEAPVVLLLLLVEHVVGLLLMSFFAFLLWQNFQNGRSAPRGNYGSPIFITTYSPTEYVIMARVYYY